MIYNMNFGLHISIEFLRGFYELNKIIVLRFKQMSEEVNI